jgi:uncharacterized membrane protein SpoIIM required for sporulation
MFSFINKVSGKSILFLAIPHFALEIPKLIGIVDGGINLLLHLLIGYISLKTVYNKYKKSKEHDLNGN